MARERRHHHERDQVLPVKRLGRYLVGTADAGLRRGIGVPVGGGAGVEGRDLALPLDGERNLADRAGERAVVRELPGEH